MSARERAGNTLSPTASRAFWESVSFAERFFMGLDEVHKALLKLTQALEPGSKGMRDTELGVKIDVLLSGDYPGDGKPKPVRFPDPSVAVRGDGFRVLSMKDLIEMKLASGLTNPDRLKDLADVQELIRHASVPLELANELDTSVRAKFVEIWSATRRGADDEE